MSSPIRPIDRVRHAVCVSGLMLVGIEPARSGAQAATPQTSAPQTIERPMTAAEDAWGLELYYQAVLTPVAGYGALVRPDSVEPAILNRAHAWVESLQQAPV